MLLDPETFDLVPRAERSCRPRPAASSPSSLARAVRIAGRVPHAGLRDVADAAPGAAPDPAPRGRGGEAQGLRLGSAGTHPFSLFERQRIMRRDRYRALIDQLQYAGRRELIYGLHVHVAVDDPDRAIRIVNALRAHLCELVALSANSPFWRGEPTGFASCRHLIFAAFPRSGPPPDFGSYDEYADVIEQLVEAGASRTTRGPGGTCARTRDFGTVEVRVMDAVHRVEDAIALAAYVQALVHRYAAATAGAPPCIRWSRTRTSGARRATGSTPRWSTPSRRPTPVSR